MNERAVILASRALARIMADKRPDLAWTPDPDLTPLHHQGEGRAERPEAETLPAAPAPARRAA